MNLTSNGVAILNIASILIMVRLIFMALVVTTMNMSQNIIVQIPGDGKMTTLTLWICAALAKILSFKCRA